MHPPDKVLIAGAGIGGLTLGRALRNAGIACEILERQPELRVAGAGILLQTAAMLALRSLGLERAVIAAGAEVQGGSIKTDRGRTLGYTPLTFLKDEFGVPTVALHRARLQQVLLESVAEVPLHLGAVVASYAPDADGVSVTLTDGRTLRGSLLVGADGLHSAVRRQLLGETPLRYAGYTSWRGIATADAEDGRDGAELWGRGARFGYTRIGHGETYWFAVLNAAAGGKDEDALGTLRREFARFAPPVATLLAATPPDRVLRTDIHDREPVSGWSSTNVTLLGDAAHPTTPNLGQGGCMAIEDAVTLARALSHAPTLPAALAEYERRRLAATAAIVRASFRFGRVAQFSHPFAVLVRNLMLRLTPKGVVQAQLRRQAQFELGTGA